VFAHRGAGSFAPENSLPAFEKAIKMGCDGIELDVRRSADGHIIVFHDRHTYRMTRVRGNIHRLNLSDIRSLYLKQSNFPLEKIPTLPEILDLAGKNVLINIDVKKENFSNNGFEEKILQIIDDFKCINNVIISSFNPFLLKKIALLNPKIHLGFIFRNRSSMMMLNGHPVKSLHARFPILSIKYLSNLYQRSSKVYAWTVDEGKKMIELIKKGVDGIITNKPELYLQIKSELTQNPVNIY
jgi:glycerophosphoryl diester phosphodiesterase